MTSVFDKLNWKGQTEILVLNAPESFAPALTALENVTVRREVSAIQAVTFSLAFVTQLAEVNAFAEAIAAKTQGDALVWFAYPKATSKKYRCGFNRDSGWESLGAAGFEVVRQVAIDEDWSALRFRRVEFIRKLSRTTLPAMTEQGQQRVAKKEKPAQ